MQGSCFNSSVVFENTINESYISVTGVSFEYTCLISIIVCEGTVAEYNITFIVEECSTFRRCVITVKRTVVNSYVPLVWNIAPPLSDLPFMNMMSFNSESSAISKIPVELAPSIVKLLPLTVNSL